MTSIGIWAFYGCGNLCSLDLPEGLTSIGVWAFKDCNSLSSLDLPEGLTSIGYGAFYGCESLSSLDLPEGLTSIGDWAFFGCESLSSLDLPEGLTSIGEGAFCNCNKLNIIWYKGTEEKWNLISKGKRWKERTPSDLQIHFVDEYVLATGISVQSSDILWKMGDTSCKIEAEVLPENASEKELRFFSSNEKVVTIDTVGNCTLVAPGAAVITVRTIDRKHSAEINITVLADSENDNMGKVFSYFVENEEVNITGYHGTDSEVSVPEKIQEYPVKRLAEKAFYNCDFITEIILPDGIEQIGESAFAECDLLKKVIIPKSVSVMEKSAFAGCSSLESVDIDCNLAVINNSTFANCGKLHTVALLNSIESISDLAFDSCKSLETVQIPSSVIEISENAFQNCNKEILVIYGYKNSYAETYANEHEINFVMLDEEYIIREEGFDLTKDGHCIENRSRCFSYGLLGYKIPFERFQEVFGEKFTKQIYNQKIGNWKGSCFGMSATAAMFYLGILPVADYTHNTGVLTEGGYDEIDYNFGKAYLKLDKSSDLTKLIERYQIWQYSKECVQAKRKYLLNHFKGSDGEYFSDILNTITTSKEPLLLGVKWKESVKGETHSHRMVVDSSRKPVNKGNGWYRIYLYDPNNPYFGNFDNKTPVDCYLQAENRYIELNVENGQWRMSSKVNSSSFFNADIGYDSKGELIPGSEINFMSANDIPSSFENKASFTYSGDIDNISIDFETDAICVKGSDDVLLFKMTEKKTDYIDDSIVELLYYDEYNEEISSETVTGKLILPKGEYTVDIESGYIAFSSDDDYAGIVAKSQTTVRNRCSTELEIMSNSSEPVNVVIEDITGDKYVSVQTDLIMNEGSTVVSVDDGKMLVDSDVDQTIDVEIITEEKEQILSELEVKKDVELSVDIKEEDNHEHVYSEWKVVEYATCTSEGLKERVCSECGEKESEIIPISKHYWTLKITKEPTVLETGEKVLYCSYCNTEGLKTELAKLEPTYKINASNITLRVGQFTKKVKITNLAKGDYIKKWTSGNKKIATVSKKGVIKGVKTGNTKITALLASGKKITINVKVQKKAVATTKIGGLTKTLSLKKGKKVTLKPVLYPITSVEKITYQSSNKKIITVNSKGVVTAKKKGKAKITVKAGKKKYVITVTVK